MRKILQKSTRSFATLGLAIFLGLGCTTVRIRPLQDAAYLDTRAKFEVHNLASELCMIYSKDDEQTKSDVLKILDRKANQFQRSLLNHRRYLAGIYGRKKFLKENNLIFGEDHDEWVQRRNAWISAHGPDSQYRTWLAATRQTAEYWVERARDMKENINAVDGPGMRNDLEIEVSR